MGLTKGACPDWAWGVGRYGRLGNGKGHLFLTLFFQSFLLFHFLVLAPQFYPRCNVSRRERQRESEAGQTDEMETPTTQAASVSGTGLQIKRSREIFIEGKGGGETSRDLMPSPCRPAQELNSFPHLNASVKILPNVRAREAFDQAPSFWCEETDPKEAETLAQDHITQGKLLPHCALSAK